MKNKEIIYGVIGLLLGILISHAFTYIHTNNEMIGSSNTRMGSTSNAPSAQQVAQIKQEEDQGQKLLQSIQSKAKSCKDLSLDNFEKIGDLVMKQRVGTSEKHAVMDAGMEQMMGKDQNVQMHIALGKNAAGCSTPTDITNTGGSMMMHDSTGN